MARADDDVDLRRRLRRLEDIEAIRRLLTRYARALDRGDWAGMRGCFAADATDDHGPYQGSVDTLVSGTRDLLAGYRGTMHVLGQSLIEVDGEAATAETYALSFHRRHCAEGAQAGDEDTVTGIRYLDRLVRTGGGWLIAARVTVQEWNTTIAARDWIDAAEWVNGAADRSDPSYALGLP